MRASTERIRRDLEYLATCSTGDTGITRLTFTPEEMAARAYLAEQMEQAGLQVRTDAVGNVIGRLEGIEPELPVIMIGSHMDSIRAGGNFDGMAGVVAGIEALRILRELGHRPRCSIEVVGITGEENSRFFPGVVGSRGMNGELTKEELYTTMGSDGVLLADAMRMCGFDPERIGEAVRPKGSIALYLELHIEQSKVLETTNTAVGVVTSICGAAHMDVEILGAADHAGGTPMNMRSDALAAMAELALEAERLAVAAGHDTVATLGKLDVEPNIPNVIPGRAKAVLDIRSSRNVCNEQVIAGLQQSLEQICARRGCRFYTSHVIHGDPTPVSEQMQQLLMDTAEQLGISHRRIYSGAGHDAVLMYKLCPVAMLFVPSRDGRSHCPEEWTEYSQVAAGTEVLAQAVIRLTT